MFTTAFDLFTFFCTDLIQSDASWKLELIFAVIFINVVGTYYFLHVQIAGKIAKKKNPQKFHATQY